MLQITGNAKWEIIRSMKKKKPGLIDSWIVITFSVSGWVQICRRRHPSRSGLHDGGSREVTRLQLLQGVIFTNILCADFSYDSYMRSFFVLEV
jgi:hypothetical protein